MFSLGKDKAHSLKLEDVVAHTLARYQSSFNFKICSKHRAFIQWTLTLMTILLSWYKPRQKFDRYIKILRALTFWIAVYAVF